MLLPTAKCFCVVARQQGAVLQLGPEGLLPTRRCRWVLDGRQPRGRPAFGEAQRSNVWGRPVAAGQLWLPSPVKTCPSVGRFRQGFLRRGDGRARPAAPAIELSSGGVRSVSPCHVWRASDCCSQAGNGGHPRSNPDQAWAPVYCPLRCAKWAAGRVLRPGHLQPRACAEAVGEGRAFRERAMAFGERAGPTSIDKYQKGRGDDEQPQVIQPESRPSCTLQQSTTTTTIPTPTATSKKKKKKRRRREKPAAKTDGR